MAHIRCSVVFDWNTRLALSMKPVHDHILMTKKSTEDPYQSLYIPKTMLKLSSATHNLISLSIPWIPN